MKIDINYVARVEGEGSVELELDGKELKGLKLNICEPPRFFEGFLYGRRFDEAPDIVARICGICPVSHMVTAIRAIEKALSITPSKEVVRMRRIMSLSQMMASHIVHLYVLALPDYHRAGSVIDMLPGAESAIKRMLRMKEVVNDLTSIFGGRALHPVSMVVGGFTSVPSGNEIKGLVRRLEAIKEDAVETVKMISELSVPSLKSSHESVAIRSNSGYAINEGCITSTMGLALSEEDYHKGFEETVVPHSNAKKSIVKGRGAFIVGALSRLNINADMLHFDAKKLFKDTDLSLPEANPFYNNLAQAIEVVHGISECIELLDGLNIKESMPPDFKIKEGEGTAVTEAPRGMLMHRYEINRKGLIEKADIVTPTAHNSLSMEENLRKLVEKYIEEPQDELIRKCEMLVRAYDPCFSCSVH